MERGGVRPAWWGGRWHTWFTITVFVVLASLDNAALGVPIPLIPVISEDLGVSEASIGIVTALNILIVGFASVVWGFLGDRGGRKRLLLYGTFTWSIAFFFVGLSGSYLQFLVFEIIAAAGMGCIASVGFSVISDFVPPRRRGLMMGLWGLSQGVGVGGGLLLGGLLGAASWSVPFFVVAVAGLAFAALYFLAYDPERGRSEEELAGVFAAGGGYEHTITAGDVLRLVQVRSNVWLVAQGFTAQFAYGALIWLPRMFTAKVEAQGFSTETAIMAGSIFAVIFQVGGLFSLLGGHIGDRWQQRDPRGRAMLSAIGILSAVPFYLGLFFLPMHGLDVPDGGGNIEVIVAVALSVVTNPWVAGAFVLGLVAVALTAIDAPNWFALIIDVNLPEHRGTTFGLGNLTLSVGRSLGSGAMLVTFGYLAMWLPPGPLNFVLGLALFQVFFLPAAFFYYRATKTTPRDIARVKATLASRAKASPESP